MFEKHPTTNQQTKTTAHKQKQKQKQNYLLHHKFKKTKATP